MHKITMVELYGTSGESPGKKFRMYRANRHGLDEILKKMWEHKCSAGEVGSTVLGGFLPKYLIVHALKIAKCEAA